MPASRRPGRQERSPVSERIGMTRLQPDIDNSEEMVREHHSHFEASELYSVE